MVHELTLSWRVAKHRADYQPYTTRASDIIVYFYNTTIDYIIEKIGRHSVHVVASKRSAATTHEKTHNLYQTCNRLVATSLLQDLFALLACSQLVDKLLQACSRLATSLMNSTALLQVVPTTCYRPASQQLVSNKLGTRWRNDSIATTCWHACYKHRGCKLVANTTCWQDVRFLRV